MRKTCYLGILLLSWIGFLTTGCSETYNDPSLPSALEITTEIPKGNPIMMAAGGSCEIQFKADQVQELTVNASDGWTTETDLQKGVVKVTAPDAGTSGNQQYKMVLTAHSGAESIQSKEIWFYCVQNFNDPKGTFVLNEGNMTTENGSLSYITPEGYIVDDAYKLVNGTELGNVTQDLCIHDGKIYIISQNGDRNPVGSEFQNDGMLVIADAKTLKKVDAFKKEELKGLTWPSHIMVLDEEHVYIRDNGVAQGDNGSGKIWRLNTRDRSLTEVQHTTGVPKSPLYERNGKIYTYNHENKFGFLNYFYILEIAAGTDEATVYSVSTGDYVPVNILPAQKENTFWTLIKKDDKEEVAYKLTQASLREVNKTVSILYPSSVLEDTPNSGSSGVMLVSPSDDTFYYTSATYLIKGSYAEKSAGDASGIQIEVSTEAVADLSELDSNARIVYNGMGIHPETGHLYINTIKGMGGSYTTNTIWEFDPAQGFTTPANQWNNYTNFPAGFFFPASANRLFYSKPHILI